MAHNSRTRPDWITGAIPTEAEFDDLDQKTFEALNGDQGGTWAPASRIHLGGAGLQMDANLLINRAVDLNGDGLGFRGKIVERVATLPDGNLVFPLVGSDFGFIGRVTSAVTGTRTYDLGAATSGDTVTFLCIGFAGSVTIRDQALATLFSLGQGDAHDGDWVTLMFDSVWRVFRRSNPRVRRVTFGTPGNYTWTVPSGVFRVFVSGCGGGAGGAGGAPGTTAVDNYIRGGGGGGGASYHQHIYDVTPGAIVNVVVAAGGIGGVSGMPGNFGPESNFDGHKIYGSNGGLVYISPSTQPNVVSAGGTAAPRIIGAFSDLFATSTGLSEGGYGASGYSSTMSGIATGLGIGGPGGDSTSGFSGGVGGAVGTDAGTHRGGGGGGGGGAGPFGLGGSGGDGGSGNNLASGGFSAANGPSAGGGGGGGGGGGCTNLGIFPGGNGGDGGPGFVEIVWVK